jgi:hypothetical protein
VLTSRPVLSGVGSGPLLLGNGGDEAMHFANYIVLGLLIAFMLGALSFTKKAAPMSSTDHGGGKRRASAIRDVNPTKPQRFD